MDPGAVTPDGVAKVSVLVQAALLATVWAVSRNPSSAFAPARRDPLFEDIGPRTAAVGAGAGLAALAGVALAVAATAVVALEGGTPGDFAAVDVEGAKNTAEVADLVRCQGPGTWALLALSTCAIGPVAEELVFRGLVLKGALRAGLGAAPAAVLSTALFLASHPFAADWPRLAPMSLAMSAAAVVPGGGLTSAALGHVLYNTVVFAGTVIEAKETSGVCFPYPGLE